MTPLQEYSFFLLLLTHTRQSLRWEYQEFFWSHPLVRSKSNTLLGQGFHLFFVRRPRAYLIFVHANLFLRIAASSARSRCFGRGVWRRRRRKRRTWRVASMARGLDGAPLAATWLEDVSGHAVSPEGYAAPDSHPVRSMMSDCYWLTLRWSMSDTESDTWMPSMPSSVFYKRTAMGDLRCKSFK